MIKKSMILMLLITISILIINSGEKVYGTGSDEKIGTVSFFSGDAIVIRNGKEKKVSIGMELYKNDIVKLDEYAKMMVKFKNKIQSRYTGPTKINLSDTLARLESRKKISLKQLLSGTLNKIKKNKSSGSVTAVVGVRGDDVANQKAKINEEELSWAQ